MSEVKETKVKKPIVKYPDLPQKLTDIDSQYIKDYISKKYANGEISSDEVLNWATKYDECVKAKDKRTFFMPFRKAFAKAYFPHLLDKKPKKDKKQMGDFLRDLIK